MSDSKASKHGSWICVCNTSIELPCFFLELYARTQMFMQIST